MRIKKKHILIEYDEREMGDGYWIILRPGWKWAGDPQGCVHAIHEDSKREAYRENVMACTCKDCAN